MKVLDFFEVRDSISEDVTESIIKADYDRYLRFMEINYAHIRNGHFDRSPFPPGFPESYKRGKGLAHFTEMIYEAYRNDVFNQILIEGIQGAGKTSLALWIARLIYGNWVDAIKHIVIDPLQLKDMIMSATMTGIKIPLVVIDDAGLMFSKQATIKKKGRGRMNAIQSVMQVIRTAISNVIITLPNEEELSGIVARQPSQYKVMMYPATSEVSEAHVYHDVVMPIKGKKITKKVNWVNDLGGSDERVDAMLLRSMVEANVIFTPRKIDTTAYTEYMKLRRSYTTIALRQDIGTSE
jgi:hypothetical protein